MHGTVNIKFLIRFAFVFAELVWNIFTLLPFWAEFLVYNTSTSSVVFNRFVLTRENVLLGASCFPVRVSIGMHLRDFYWMVLHKFLYKRLLCNSVEKTQNYLMRGKHIVQIIRRPIYVYIFKNSIIYFVVWQRCKGNPFLRFKNDYASSI